MGMLGLPLGAPLDKGKSFPALRLFKSLREYNDSGLGTGSVTYIVACRKSVDMWNRVKNNTARSLLKRVRTAGTGTTSRKLQRIFGYTIMNVNNSPKKITPRVPISLRTRKTPVRTTLLKSKISK
jgi:hypothetical protein